MSAYKVHEVKISEEEDIIAGLIEMGFLRSEIEVHQTAQPLLGFRNDIRQNKANIIVRRSNVNKRMSGSASNDIGFEKSGDTYKSHVSDYDQSWWKRKEPVFKQGAAVSKVTRNAKRKGYRVKKEQNDKKIRLRLIKNR